MDWNLAMEDNRRMLRRIVAMLFALADLAERLTGVPRPVRVHVLRILRSAETVARDFVFETAQHATPLPADFDALHDGDSPADAMRLAQSFRTLAFLLNWLAEHNSGRDRRTIAPHALIARLLAATSFERGLPAPAHLAVECRNIDTANLPP